MGLVLLLSLETDDKNKRFDLKNFKNVHWNLEGKPIASLDIYLIFPISKKKDRQEHLATYRPRTSSQKPGGVHYVCP